ncbi:MAG: DUF3102 domain-containing protein [Oscillospiraceae bacterium]|nr:DUF3102 domain-containing protein [Oscillospiraceae bacterium]
MSNIITSTARTAATIAAEIRVIHEQARESALRSIIEIGRRLCEAKELVDHGDWCAYLQNELGYKQSAANNYMKIFREYEANGLMANSQTFGNLSPSQALALIAVPAEEREDFIREADVENLSARELKQAIRERDAAVKEQEAVKAERDEAKREAAVQAEEARLARQELLVLQQKAETAKASEDAWKEEIEKLTGNLAKVRADLASAKDKLKEQNKNPKISDAMREQIAQEEAQAAAEKVRAELRQQLAEAEAALQKVTQEREAAERAAREAEAALAVQQKNAKLSDPDVMAFNVMVQQIDREFNVLFGYRMKILTAHPEMAQSVNAFVNKLLDKQRSKLNGAAGT